MGRRRRFCSVGCRRAAEFELRRIQDRLQLLESRRGELRHHCPMGLRDQLGRTQAEEVADVDQEIRECEARLRALLNYSTFSLRPKGGK